MSCSKKVSLSLATLAASASLFAGGALDSRLHEVERKVGIISTMTAAGALGIETSPARPAPDGHGWFLTFDVLYWQCKVGYASYAESVPSIANTLIYEASEREPKFSWTFAFKAGVGYDFFHDSWDVRTEYTYFRNSGHDEYGVSSPAAIYPASSILYYVLDSLADFATSSYGSLKLSLDDLILDLGRAFFLSKYLSLRPSAGLKASWIALTGNVRFSGGSTITAITPSNSESSTTLLQGLGIATVYGTQKEQLFGLGPRAGIDANWHLGNDFSLYSNLSGALLFGYFRNNISASGTYGTITSIESEQYKTHRLVPTVDFALGLMYDSYIMCDTQHFSIGLGYETQYYWEASLLTEVPTGIGIYGVNLNLRWDF